MGDRIKGKPALDFEQRFLAGFRLERVIGLNTPGILSGFLQSAPGPITKLAEGSGTQRQRAGLEALDCGNCASFGDLFNDFKYGSNDFGTPLWIEMRCKLGNDIRALFHEVVACGVTLKRDSFCEGGPSLERALAGDREDAACCFEVLERNSAGAFQI